MSRISVRGFAVASATAVTSVGAVVGVASGADTASDTGDRYEATAADQTLLADIPAQQDVRSQYASLTEQADAAADTAQADARTALQEAARKQAASDAQDKKEAAEKAAAEREAAEQAASRDGSSFTVQSSYSISEVQAIARQMVPADQFQCFSNIVDHESGWNYTASNPSSGAYGLMQALPGSKMESAGSDWQTNPATQIEWGLNYMNSRYGSPCGAWNFWQANNWY
ncbi:transglycosylase SLT domain-containing protein [Streptomyces sp. NPDC051940]|uniref:aggregation-promoting factor C-terminal-like domain-containing protein n=1 Tax=Streptomyces sp. NPDC051940 TaxID=3155675 RepID=UPI003412809A